MRKIITSHVYPPIPIRTCDWCAIYGGDEEGGPRGWGATEAEAIADLIAEFPDDADVEECPHCGAVTPADETRTCFGACQGEAS